jgi:hypothetical protein
LCSVSVKASFEESGRQRVSETPYILPPKRVFLMPENPANGRLHVMNLTDMFTVIRQFR